MLARGSQLLYRVIRRLRRGIRWRFAGRLTALDLRRLHAAMHGRDARQLLLDHADLAGASWPDGWQEWLSPDEAAAVVARADDACAHRFDLLGSGPVDLGDPIDWHRDLKSGFRWPEDAHHLRIAWDAVPPGTDIKVPWELSRCQHFAALALADRVTGDARYYDEFKAQIGSWISANPCGFGVNWVCAMDVAIRTVNWLAAAALFRARLAADTDDSFAGCLVESLWLHGRHIMRNLEWQGPRSTSLSNHFLADLCGVLAVGALFRHCPQGRRWLDFACRWLEVEMRRQVFPDGANFETSTSYHRLTHEMFLWADTLAGRLGRPFSTAYRQRLGAMAGFVAAYTSPAGRAAQFGDNDSGRLLAVGIDDPRDHRYLTAGPCGFGGRANRLLLADGDPPGVAGPVPNMFPDAGFWFASVGDAWLGVRAGVVSHGGAHAHADQLGFVLSLAGREVIVDPGTGTYSADVEKRNAYRSSASHNAPRLNDLEANRFPPGKAGLFRMADDTRTEVLTWEATPEAVRFTGRHHGYERARAGCLCERSLTLRAGTLTVADRVSPLLPGDRISWSFRLAPEVGVTAATGGAILTMNGLTIRVTTEPALECSVTTATFSPGYGVEVASHALHLVRQATTARDACQRIVLDWQPPAES